MENIDLTYNGKLQAYINVIKKCNLDVSYTVDGKTGEITTLSILIDPKTFEMITFNYQDLKKLVGDIDEKR